MNNLDQVIENSFKNFHAKGLDYICMKRSEDHTEKYYFFDGDFTKLPEVVNPHDHRYNFLTTVVAGKVDNMWWGENLSFLDCDCCTQVFQEFDWMTPLNGGSGFTWRGEKRLEFVGQHSYSPGQKYYMEAWEIHTIGFRADQSIIKLDQYKDEIPLDQPTKTYCMEEPALDGLYEKFTPDEVLKKLQTLRSLGVDIPSVET